MGALGPRTDNLCPDEICQDVCTCKAVQSEPYFDPDEPRPVSAIVPPAAAGGGGRGGGEICEPSEPCVCEPVDGTSKPFFGQGVTADLCPDEICEEPCTCKVVPSEGYIDSDTELRPQRIPMGAGAIFEPKLYHNRLSTLFVSGSTRDV